MTPDPKKSPLFKWLLILLSGGFLVLAVMLYFYLSPDKTSPPLESREASLQKQTPGSISSFTTELIPSAKDIKVGELIFQQHCASCHGQNAEGKIGPNLTDEYWLHGNAAEDLVHIVTQGVPDKGMVAWKDILTPSTIEQVVAYVQSIKDSNPPNPKAPEGKKY